jgi:hypothetical protein
MIFSIILFLFIIKMGIQEKLLNIAQKFLSVDPFHFFRTHLIFRHMYHVFFYNNPQTVKHK